MKYISRNYKEIIYLSLTLFVSFLMLISAYVIGCPEYSITINYLLLVFIIWITSLTILYLVFKHIRKKLSDNKKIERAKAKIILYTIMFLLIIGGIISAITGYIISVGTTSYYALVGYLAGLTMSIPGLVYFGLFLHKINFRKTLYLHTLINMIIIGFGLYYSVWG
jgi:uncharacterized membrane protein YidH (DUF202 family)